MLVACLATSALADWLPDSSTVPVADWGQQPHCQARPVDAATSLLFAELKARISTSARLHICEGKALDLAQALPDQVIEISETIAKLPKCQLAFVLGHELGHLRLHHADAEVRLIAYLARLPEVSAPEAMAAIDFNLGLGLMTSEFLQAQEKEADWVGQFLAAEVGCAPEVSGEAWLASLAGLERNSAGVLATHPPARDRLEALRAWRSSATTLLPLTEERARSW